MARTTTGKVEAKNHTATVICKQSFLTDNAAISGKIRRTRNGQGTLASVCLLLVCAVIFGAVFSKPAAKAHEIRMPQNGQTAPAELSARTEEVSFLSVIAYETITYSEATMYEGDTVVLTEGHDGVRRVTQTLEYNEMGESEIVSVTSTIIVDAIAEEIAVGTLERPLTASYGKYIWPADGKLNSEFGLRSVGVGSSNHQGIDISGKKGDIIIAADGGEVIRADSKLSGYGKLVIIQHDNGDITFYAHNSELLVEVGERVYRGQEIARMGATGVTSGVHLHFELRIDDEPVNPIDFLPQPE